MIKFALILLSIAHAENWMRVSDVQAGLVRGFELERECKVDGAQCEKVDGKNLSALKVQSGRIVEDAVKIKELEKKISDEVAAKAARAAKIETLKQSSSQEIRMVTELLDEKK